MFLADLGAETRNQEEHRNEDDETILFYYFVDSSLEIFFFREGGLTVEVHGCDTRALWLSMAYLPGEG